MSSGFVTESEVAEARRKRQEEWERVRNSDQPLEAPEEPYDARSLFDRLQEQKQKKDLEYEEAHKLKNMIKGLDDDEIEFLDLVDRTKLAADRKITLDEERELNDYRNRVATLQEKTLDQRLYAEINVTKPKTAPNARSSQMKLLKGVVVKKPEPKRKRSSGSEDESPTKKSNISPKKEENNSTDLLLENGTKRKLDETTDPVPYSKGALTCIGILPGLGCYSDSSESTVSSDSEDEHKSCSDTDFLGRRVKKEKDE